MNLSRLYSCLYKQNYSVGRVQTPTLSMIVNRDEEINNFKKEKYFTVEILTKDFILSTQRIDDYEVADQLRNLLPEEITIHEVEEKEKITKPDKLYDLTKLQRECIVFAVLLNMIIYWHSIKKLTISDIRYILRGNE